MGCECRMLWGTHSNTDGRIDLAMATSFYLFFLSTIILQPLLFVITTDVISTGLLLSFFLFFSLSFLPFIQLFLSIFIFLPTEGAPDVLSPPSPIITQLPLLFFFVSATRVYGQILFFFFHLFSLPAPSLTFLSSFLCFRAPVTDLFCCYHFFRLLTVIS